KIRNCLNIEGVAQQLPLFEPPIDPGLLVRAAAAGVDLNSVLNDMAAPPPLYRVQIVAQKATEFVSEVRALGGALLAALEKRDAEDLALLRAGHELDLLKAVRDVKQKQIDEAQAALDGLQRTKDVTTARRDYYQNIVKISDGEQSYMDNM